MELVLFVESDHFITGAPEGHESFEVSVIQACNLFDQRFCEPAVNEFLLFLQDQTVLKAPHHLVFPELEGTDQAVGVKVAC